MFTFLNYIFLSQNDDREEKKTHRKKRVYSEWLFRIANGKKEHTKKKKRKEIRSEQEQKNEKKEKTEEIEWGWDKKIFFFALLS